MGNSVESIFFTDSPFTRRDSKIASLSGVDCYTVGAITNDSGETYGVILHIKDGYGVEDNSCATMITNEGVYYRRRTKDVGKLHKATKARRAMAMIRETKREMKDGRIMFAVNNRVYVLDVDNSIFRVSIPNSLDNPRPVSVNGYYVGQRERVTLGGTDISLNRVIYALRTEEDDLFYKYINTNKLDINHCVIESGIYDIDGRVFKRPDPKYFNDMRYLEVITKSENVRHGVLVHEYKLYGVPVTAKKHHLDGLRRELERVELEYERERRETYKDEHDLGHDFVEKELQSRCISAVKEYNREHGLFLEFQY